MRDGDGSSMFFRLAEAFPKLLAKALAKHDADPAAD